MDESAAKVRLDKADQPSEINELRTEISQLITEKEEAIQNQSFESAAGFVKKKTSDGKTRRIDCSERKVCLVTVHK